MRGSGGCVAPAMWGVVYAALQPASPLVFWWLDTATVYALGLALIASVSIGFAVADGRWVVLAVESNAAAPAAGSSRARDVFLSGVVVRGLDYEHASAGV